MAGAIVSGLVGPDALDKERLETLWHYMQGSRRLQGDLYFQDRRRHPRPRRADRHEALSAVPAVRRIRLFLHAGRDDGGG
jgi:hypothetical protein